MFKTEEEPFTKCHQSIYVVTYDNVSRIQDLECTEYCVNYECPIVTGALWSMYSTH